MSMPAQIMGQRNVNGNMQNLAGGVSMVTMEPGFPRQRALMRLKIFEVIVSRRQQPPNEAEKHNLCDLAKRVETTLYKLAETMEEYLNARTMDARVNFVLKRLAPNAQNQQYQELVNSSSSSVATMIPTLGMPRMGNLNLMVSGAMDTSSNTALGGMLGGSFNRSDEFFFTGCQQLPNKFSTGSVVPQRTSSHMIPTPGFDGNRNPNVDGEMGSGVRQWIQQKPYEMSNCTLNGGLGVIAGNGYRMSNAVSFGDENFNSLGSIVNCQTFPVSKRTFNTMSNQSNVHSMQQSLPVKHEPIDQPGKTTSQSSSLLKSNQQHHFLKQFEQPQFVQRQQPREQNQLPRHLQNNGTCGQSKLLQNHNSQLCHAAQIKPPLEGHWHSSQDRIHISRDRDVREGFHQRISQKCNNLSSQGFGISQTGCSVIATTTMPSNGDGDDSQSRCHQQWLNSLLHTQACTAPKGKCLENSCSFMQDLCHHIKKCSSPECQRSHCEPIKSLILHFKKCRDYGCPVCVGVRIYQRQLKASACSSTGSDVTSSSGCVKSNNWGNSSTGSILEAPQDSENADLQPSLKRLKIDQSSQCVSESVTPSSAASKSESHGFQEDCKSIDACIPSKSVLMDVKMDVSMSSSKMSSLICEMKKESPVNIAQKSFECEPIICDEPDGIANQVSMKVEKETEQPKQENVPQPTENAAGTKPGKSKVKAVSMIELFTPEQVREHIAGLRQWVGQSKAKVEKNQAMERFMTANSCQLCAVEKLTFEPPPVYCTTCGVRIKRNTMYYTGGTGETHYYICIPCYNNSRGVNIVVNGKSTAKAQLEKKKNDEETEESWVQCDKCELWQHQVCALFNGRRNDGGKAEYTCPDCYVKEVEKTERKPLPQSAVLGAQDLPKTMLSDHIEHRLFRRLKEERQERARLEGKTVDEVPGAESLVVRVISSVDKKLEVKKGFFEIFEEMNYAKEFPYKSKVVLLFQKIEGVEVCLFGMYVQEFGTDCAAPNQRRVYLSYLDSVKYFRPEVRAVTGEALRTFVYHEILIGYLGYCKRRGFSSCYIWACPPLKGEDYILYCHPEIQKTPKTDKLREWYLAMLKKASAESIVVELTNLHDHFFVSPHECKAKVTAARLPYFDGDYWPGAAEDLIQQMNQDEGSGKLNKNLPTKKTITKRALKLSCHSDLSGNASKDLLLMNKLGGTISPMKEDFIMVHLQHCCNHCSTFMVSGNRWVCNQCKNFQMCDECYEAEERREERERHPLNQRDLHTFSQVEITDIPADMKDEDEILESEHFDSRQAYLTLCQANHYQYDTLRRAKHSSMMMLYHLHNPSAPAFVTTCNVCRSDIETGQGWRCEVCPDFDACNSCYKKDGGIGHPHNLTHHTSITECDAQNKDARQKRVQQLRTMLDLLAHASLCRSLQCQYPNCRRVKGLFNHGHKCKKRVMGGCILCKKMWNLLQLHARACKESNCHVPRCKDLQAQLRHLQQQAESRRRAAVTEMMRQRAAEVANGS